MQAQAKLGEVAFCVWAGLDPMQAIDWSVGTPDPGSDVKLFDTRFDVKTCGANARCLLWPLMKNADYVGKPFDVLALVRVVDTWRCQLVGWITKLLFWTSKHIAPDGPARGLRAGTWYVDEVELSAFTVPSVWRAEF